MELVESLNLALKHIEQHLMDETDSEKAARQVGLSRFYLERTFASLTGMSVSEYIRARRLTLAAQELISDDAKVIDLALKYGYDTPESFTKAFTRFHGVTPSSARRMCTMLRCQNPLAISIQMEGATRMDYKIEAMDAFTVVGVEEKFQMDSSQQEIPKYWDDFFKKGLHEKVCPMFGICFDADADGYFPYMIGEVLRPGMKVPEGMLTHDIPAHTWARFACVGPMPGAIQAVTKQIYSEWLPTNGTYEVAQYVEIEMYSDGDTTAKDYYSEVWIPIKKKA
ncbi:MAG: AraC family transcriptional regulator [Eubacteriales bacterium]|nr:AraC family transcriptional regulator [Eubacteriales bacterium]